MSVFFLIIEISIYISSIFLIIRKGELAIIYLPVLAFAHNIIDPVFSAFFFYAAITLVFLFLISKNASYYRNNIFSFLLFIYFIVLLPGSSDLTFIRPFVFGVLWLFTFIPLVSTIYKKYP